MARLGRLRVFIYPPQGSGGEVEVFDCERIDSSGPPLALTAAVRSAVTWASDPPRDMLFYPPPGSLVIIDVRE